MLFRFVFLFIFIAGCASVPNYSPTGFLSDYARMQQSPNRESVYYYLNGEADLSAYSKVIIDPIVVFMHSDSQGAGLNAEELTRLTNSFRDAMVDAFKGNYKIVKEASPDTLRFRIALTGVVASKPAYNILWATALSGIGVGGASMELEWLDSNSEEVLLSVYDVRKGKRYDKLSGLTKWKHTENVFKEWARRAKEFLDSKKGAHK